MEIDPSQALEDNTEASDRNTAASDRNTASHDVPLHSLRAILTALKITVACLVAVVVLGVGGFFYFDQQEDQRQERVCEVLHSSFDAHTRALIRASGGDVEPATVATFNEDVHTGIDEACH